MPLPCRRRHHAVPAGSRRGVPDDQATVQKALGVLSDGGWIKRIANVGIFVRDHSEEDEPTSLEIKALLDQSLRALEELGRRVDRLEAAAEPPGDQPRR